MALCLGTVSHKLPISPQLATGRGSTYSIQIAHASVDGPTAIYTWSVLIRHRGQMRMIKGKGMKLRGDRFVGPGES